jgi:hypothetical protein
LSHPFSVNNLMLYNGATSSEQMNAAALAFGQNLARNFYNPAAAAALYSSPELALSWWSNAIYNPFTAYNAAAALNSRFNPFLNQQQQQQQSPGLSNNAASASASSQSQSATPTNNHHNHHHQLQQQQHQQHQRSSKSHHHEDSPKIREPKSSKQSHIKKPLNAFMLFMKEQRAKVVSECTLRESAAINQILGRKWHELERSEQAKYYEQARQERLKHMQEYPGWSARDNYGLKKKRKRKREKVIGDNGELPRKCRARYGLQQIHLWCKPCRRKKKCIRFTGQPEDPSGASSASSINSQQNMLGQMAGTSSMMPPGMFASNGGMPLMGPNGIPMNYPMGMMPHNMPHSNGIFGSEGSSAGMASGGSLNGVNSEDDYDEYDDNHDLEDDEEDMTDDDSQDSDMENKHQSTPQPLQSLALPPQTLQSQSSLQNQMSLNQLPPNFNTHKNNFMMNSLPNGLLVDHQTRPDNI